MHNAKPGTPQVVIISLSMVLVACSPAQEGEQAPQFTLAAPESLSSAAPAQDQTAPIVTAQPQAVEADPAAAAQAAAVRLVAQSLNIPEQSITVQGPPASVQWEDSSLGCPQPGQIYAEGMTPGYLITLAAADAVYTVHTDQAGRAVICAGDASDAATSAAPDPVVAAYIDQARADLADRLDVPPDEVILVRSEAVEWRSSALGCVGGEQTPEVDVVVPGYRIELAVVDERYLYHADAQRLIYCAELRQ